MKESYVESTFHKLIVQCGGYSWKWNGQKGVPDRVVVYRGVVYFVELKADGGRLSPHQILQHKRLCSLGANVAVLTGITETRGWVNELCATGTS
jgi:hypothetical protein